MRTQARRPLLNELKKRQDLTAQLKDLRRQQLRILRAPR